ATGPPRRPGGRRLLAAELGDERHLDWSARAVRAAFGDRDRPLGVRRAAEGADDADLELRRRVAAAPARRRRRDGEGALRGHRDVDTKAASALGAALRRLRYSETAVLDMLGDDAYSHDRDELPRDERRVAPTRLGTVVRGVFLQLPVSRADLAGALGERAVDA